MQCGLTDGDQDTADYGWTIEEEEYTPEEIKISARRKLTAKKPTATKDDVELTAFTERTTMTNNKNGTIADLVTAALQNNGPDITMVTTTDPDVGELGMVFRRTSLSVENDTLMHTIISDTTSTNDTTEDRTVIVSDAEGIDELFPLFRRTSSSAMRPAQPVTANHSLKDCKPITSSVEAVDTTTTPHLEDDPT
ncbi:Protein of unknown function [Pyronema omphalodes CBS 100304]|uniref:Uncharacterized protein n=1 Tax=Pyronema omphalodes (strain CBS 100304) TaxID=1076935 RepID=U4L690_PYROM|nr:Protein of unknown function [Pyronema omphalodes CBS 100304]